MAGSHGVAPPTTPARPPACRGHARTLALAPSVCSGQRSASDLPALLRRKAGSRATQHCSPATQRARSWPGPLRLAPDDVSEQEMRSGGRVTSHAQLVLAMPGCGCQLRRTAGLCAASGCRAVVSLLASLLRPLRPEWALTGGPQADPGLSSAPPLGQPRVRPSGGRGGDGPFCCACGLSGRYASRPRLGPPCNGAAAEPAASAEVW